MQPPDTQAAPPENMSYQGFLVDGSGKALGSDRPENYAVIFRIYDAATGGTRKWSEQQIVTVDKGSFSVQLGDGTKVGSESRDPLSTVFLGDKSAERYMQLSVEVKTGEPFVTLLPRLRLLPAPYAFAATSATKLVDADGKDLVTVSSGGNGITVNGPIAGDGSALTGLKTSQIPNLDASKIASGQLAASRIPNLDAGKITTGEFDAKRIPSLDKLAGRVTGTQLQIIGDIRMGSGGTNYVASGDESLRIVYGRVKSSGVSSGAGWSGKWDLDDIEKTWYSGIIFDPPFSGEPVVMVTAEAFPTAGASPGHIILNPTIGNTTSGSSTRHVALVRTWVGALQRWEKVEYTFIAIGRR